MSRESVITLVSPEVAGVTRPLFLSPVRILGDYPPYFCLRLWKNGLDKSTQINYHLCKRTSGLASRRG